MHFLCFLPTFFARLWSWIWGVMPFGVYDDQNYFLMESGVCRFGFVDSLLSNPRGVSVWIYRFTFVQVFHHGVGMCLRASHYCRTGYPFHTTILFLFIYLFISSMRCSESQHTFISRIIWRMSMTTIRKRKQQALIFCRPYSHKSARAIYTL